MRMVTAKQWGDKAVSAVWVTSRVCTADSEKGPFLILEKKLKNTKQLLLQRNHGVGTKLIDIATRFWITLLKSHTSQLRRNDHSSSTSLTFCGAHSSRDQVIRLRQMGKGLPLPRGHVRWSRGAMGAEPCGSQRHNQGDQWLCHRVFCP